MKKNKAIKLPTTFLLREKPNMVRQSGRVLAHLKFYCREFSGRGCLVKEPTHKNFLAEVLMGTIKRQHKGVF
jgi:hypothetical protein